MPDEVQFKLKWFDVVVLCLGPLMLLVAAWQAASIEMSVKRGGTAPGVVVSNAPGARGWDNELLYPTFRFAGPDGVQRDVASLDGTKPGRFVEGQAVTVIWPAGQPEQAQIESAYTTWAIPVIVGVFGVVTTLAGILGLRVKRKVQRMFVARGVARPWWLE